MRTSSSLDRLVREHLPATLAFATRLCGDVDMAEEIVQEALVRAVRSWASFRGESAFRTWLLRIVINVFRDRLKATSDVVASLDDDCQLPDATSARPDETAMAGELAHLVADEVSRLPPRQREVLVLSVYEGLSAREVAAVVGIREANVYSTLHAARARLKEKLAPYFRSVER